jgi:hypothetical protein
MANFEAELDERRGVFHMGPKREAGVPIEFIKGPEIRAETEQVDMR